jgi:hypothetical protein
MNTQVHTDTYYRAFFNVALIPQSVKLNYKRKIIPDNHRQNKCQGSCVALFEACR